MLLKNYIVTITTIVLLNITAYAQQSVKVMSFNIHLDVASDGDNRWDERKDKVAELINYYEADFIGGQEVQQIRNGGVKKFTNVTDSYDMKYPSDHFR